MPKELNQNPRKALGKGLSALLPSRSASPTSAPKLPVEESAPEAISQPLPEGFEEFATISLDQIRPGENQPRNAFDLQKLQELADSIKANGLLQPITLYRTGAAEYRIIAGERRWRAAGMAGLSAIPALVRNVEQQKRIELALIENIQREDLNAMEIAAAFQSLASEHGLSHEQIAERTGKDRSTVTNFLRLLRLGQFARNAVISGQISMGHARVLVGITEEKLQADLCRKVIEQDLSVRAIEQLVKNLINSGSPIYGALKAVRPISEAAPLDANIRAALDAISAALGTKVTLHARNAHSGKLEIEYYSQEDLERIYSVIVD